MSKTSRKDLTKATRGAAAVTSGRRRGTLLIALGLVVAVGAVALVVSSNKKQSGSRAASPSGAASGADLPPVERRDALAAERADADSPGLQGDDAVGEVERKVDNALTGKPTLPGQPEGKRRGRHAAKE